MGTEPTHQSLGDHRSQGGGKQKRFDLHVAKARDGADGVVGVDGRKDEMTGQRSLDGDVGGHAIADFADHHHGGVLAENSAKASSEAKAYLVIDLYTDTAFERIYARVITHEECARVVGE